MDSVRKIIAVPDENTMLVKIVIITIHDTFL